MFVSVMYRDHGGEEELLQLVSILRILFRSKACKGVLLLITRNNLFEQTVVV